MHVITNNITFLSFLSFPPTLAPGPPCPHFPRLLTPLPLPFREVCSSLSLLASLCPPNRPFPFRSLLILSSLGLQSSDPRLHVTPVLLSCSWLPATSQMFITGPQVCGAICVSVCTVEWELWDTTQSLHLPEPQFLPGQWCELLGRTWERCHWKGGGGRLGCSVLKGGLWS